MLHCVAGGREMFGCYDLIGWNEEKEQSKICYIMCFNLWIS